MNRSAFYASVRQRASGVFGTSLSERFHASDCALHNLPARLPMACDCGIAKADRETAQSSGRFGCILVAALRNSAELWKMRWLYVNEKLGSPAHSLLTVAKRLTLGLRRDRTRPNEVRRSEANHHSKK